MQEFEALRFMKAENLTVEQIDAINQIRKAVPLPSNQSPLVKALTPDQAIAKLQNGDPKLTGFFATQDDLGNVATSDELVNALRLDYDGSSFSAGAPHVLMETRMTNTLSDQTRIPKSGGYLDGDPLEHELTGPSALYPNTGNGMIASKDGRLRPEWYMETPTNMPPNQTFMRYRNPDGMPLSVTVEIDGIPVTASDWMMVPHPTIQGAFQWVASSP